MIAYCTFRHYKPNVKIFITSRNVILSELQATGARYDSNVILIAIKTKQSLSHSFRHLLLHRERAEVISIRN